MRIRKTAPKEFTVDRSKWVTGGKRNTSVLGVTSLLNEKGNMCCLGFYARACGATKDSINDEPMPDYEIPLMGDKIKANWSPEGHYLTGSRFMGKAIKVNDSPRKTKKEREAGIKKLFKDKGVKVKFVGRYPKGVK